MDKIEKIVTKAAETILFEKANLLPMVEVTIKPKDEDGYSYSIKVPKALLEEIYAIGVKDGFEMYIENGAVR